MIIKENINQEITHPKDVAKILYAILSVEDEISQDREHFWVIGLDGKKAIKYIELCSLGSLTSSLIHPRETFRLAISRGIDTIIIGHNHPSGDVEPSSDDIAITDRLKDAGELLGIQVIDHVIIGKKDKFYSFSNKGRLK